MNKPGRSGRSKSALNDVTGGDYEQARIRRETAMAELAELELATKKNQLIPADMVERHWCNMVAMTRAKLLGLPSRLAVILQSCQTRQEIEREAMILVREALTELSENGNPTKSPEPLVD
jgi:hypothetical protein